MIKGDKNHININEEGAYALLIACLGIPTHNGGVKYPKDAESAMYVYEHGVYNATPDMFINETSDEEEEVSLYY